MDLKPHLERVLIGLNACQLKKDTEQGYQNIDKWHINEQRKGKKFISLDCGSSGAFLIEKETGEIFNIKGYGVPDYNKKKKADVGNIQTVNPETLFTKRYNYLR